MKKRLFLTVACILLAQAGFGQVRIRFEHLTVEEGLSQNTIHAILQDSRGFLWFGTNDGLNRYDGYDFRSYMLDLEDSHSLVNNRIYALCEDRESNIWIGTRGGLSMYDRTRDRFENYTHQPENSSTLAHNFVRTLLEDSRGNLWIGTLGGGLHRFDQENRTIIRLTLQTTGPEQNILSDMNVTSIAEDDNGNLWVATRSPGISRLDPDEGLLVFYPYKEMLGGSPAHDLGKTLFKDSRGMMWICTEGAGLLRFDPAREMFVPFRSGSFILQNEIVKGMAEDPAGEYWIVTDGSGLCIFDPGTEEIRHLRMDRSDPGGLNSDGVYSIMIDNQSIHWIGTFSGGINKYDPSQSKFELYTYQPGNPSGLSYPSVLCFFEDDPGRIWIGTDGGGINIFNREEGSFRHFRYDPVKHSGLSSDVVTAINRDSWGYTWIGTFKGGLNRYNEKTGHWKQYLSEPGSQEGLPGNNIWAIHEDRRKNLWIGTSNGLVLYDRRQDRFIRIPSPVTSGTSFSNRINHIYEDKDGNLWCGGADLYSLDPEQRILSTVPLDSATEKRLQNFDIRAIYRDQRGIMWVGSEGGGLMRIGSHPDEVEHYLTRNGLANNSVHQILEDNNGTLWISTNSGLSNFNPVTKDFRNYDSHDGLQSNQFSYAAGLKTTDGLMYFGGVEGFNVFHPDSMGINTFVPPVEITEFRISNRPVPIGTRQSPLQKHISETDEIRLGPKQSVITFYFTSLNYSSPARNQYQVRMEGFEEEWRDLGTQRMSTFTNLDPGRYTFHVRASNNDMVWNNEGRALRITVMPPWWRSWYAFTGYGLILLILILSYRRFFLNQTALKHELALKELEKNKIEEINKMELRFFTNISHEFKTPLTLILGPLEKILSQENLAESLRKHLKMMQTNGARMLRLINQLMDFRKVEQESMSLKVMQFDIVDFLREIKSAFEDLAEIREITLHIHSNRDSVLAWFDQDKIEKIIYNLISNAFKYTPNLGTIGIRLIAGTPPGYLLDQDMERVCGTDRDGWISIEVSDTGTGIDADKFDRIFERFYRLDDEGGHYRAMQEGTGIGLALSKSLIEKHHGTIRASSEPGKGSRFTISFPICREAYSGDEILELAQQAPYEFTLKPDIEYLKKSAAVHGIREEDIEGPTVLVVEDDVDVRSFIIDCIQEEFNVEGCTNGKEALESIRHKPPEIVITDVMMPELDGIELTRLIKDDIQTSHIPVILLTARDSEESKIEGLKTGAVDYIAKPFNPEELVQKVKNILHTRTKQWNIFRNQLLVEPSEITVTSQDEKFLRQAVTIVEEHIDEVDFDVSRFVGETSMSRSVLYRKMKALTGQSVNEFINTIRLKRAAQLLGQDKLSISEIAYMVGFNDPQYFSKCFRKQFACTPTQYALNQSQNGKSP